MAVSNSLLAHHRTTTYWGWYVTINKGCQGQSLKIHHLKDFKRLDSENTEILQVKKQRSVKIFYYAVFTSTWTSTMKETKKLSCFASRCIRCELSMKNNSNPRVHIQNLCIFSIESFLDIGIFWLLGGEQKRMKENYFFILSWNTLRRLKTDWLFAPFSCNASVIPSTNGTSGPITTNVISSSKHHCANKL